MPPHRALGRRPHDPDRPVLRLSRYLTGAGPEFPQAADYLSGIAAWDHYQNGRYGVCGPASLAHQRAQVTGYLAGRVHAPTQDDVFALYRALNPGFDPRTGADDNGVVLADLLSAALRGGLAGARPLAYAAVDPDSYEEVHAAIALFGSVICGLDLDEAQDEQFDAGQPFDYVRRSTDWGGHCLAPGTRVLTDDLLWVPIEELRPGDGLIGFDEFPPGGGRKRKYRRAVVQASATVDLPCYELEFEDGTTVIASEDHLWFVTSKKNGGWLRTDQMRVRGPGGQYGTKVRKLAPLWEQDTSRDAGYLAAAFDGEGWIDSGGKAPNGADRGIKKVGFTQRENVMWERVTHELKERGYEYHCWNRRGGNQQDGNSCMNLTLSGRMQFLHFLGSIRPHRLLERFYPERLGSLAEEGGLALVRKTYIGQHPVVAVGTSTGTFIAEGLASHNCVLAGAYTGLTGPGETDISIITWGQRVGCTDEFFARQLTEAWVVIWPEALGNRQFLDGVDLDRLAHDYTQLTGRPFPAAPPAAPPLDPPLPRPRDGFEQELAAFIATAQRWLDDQGRQP